MTKSPQAFIYRNLRTYIISYSLLFSLCGLPFAFLYLDRIPVAECEHHPHILIYRYKVHRGISHTWDALTDIRHESSSMRDHTCACSPGRAHTGYNAT